MISPEQSLLYDLRLRHVEFLTFFRSSRIFDRRNGKACLKYWTHDFPQSKLLFLGYWEILLAVAHHWTNPKKSHPHNAWMCKRCGPFTIPSWYHQTYDYMWVYIYKCKYLYTCVYYVFYEKKHVCIYLNIYV